MKRRDSISGHAGVWLVSVCAALLLVLCMGMPVLAGVVGPSGKEGAADHDNIQEELNNTGSVTLVSGATYYLDDSIRVRSNQTIDATGATIYLVRAAVRNATSTFKTDYSSLKNLTIKGGKWRTKNPNGTSGTTFSFAHSSNIKLLDMDIACTSPKGHAIELVACNNVTVKGCTISPKGTSKKKGQQEMLQIDLATPKTAPFLAKTSTKLQNGLACRNIHVIGNTITGDRAVCCNHASKEPKFKKYYHENIDIRNNTLIGRKAEALAVFNTITATITGNTIICYSSRVKEAYSVGLHVALFGKAKDFASKANIVVTNNIIKGGRSAFHILSHTKYRYKKLTIQNNKLYCKKGKKRALSISTVKKVKKSKNKCYNWNGK